MKFVLEEILLCPCNQIYPLSEPNYPFNKIRTDRRIKRKKDGTTILQIGACEEQT